MKTNKVDWKAISVETMQVHLDSQNPRIDASARSSQEHLRELLIENEEVIELAVSIVETGANFAGERIIVIEEERKFVVIEGNRRVCACQILLKPELLSKAMRTRIPAIETSIKSRLGSLEADLAPSREEAEPVITRRHTQPGIKGWSPVANQRRIIRYMNAGAKAEEVAKRFGITKGAVTRLLREHELLKHVRTLSGWSDVEQRKLAHPTLKTNPFTRFFTLKGSKETLGITFDENGKLKTTLEEKIFNKAMQTLARNLLLPSAGVPEFNTRTKPEDIFQKTFKHDSELRMLVSTGSGGKTTKTQLKAKADNFFESLDCPISDNQLIILSKEIKNIDYRFYKTSASFLLRAILERTLDWCVAEKKLNQEFRKYAYAERNVPQGFEPGLEIKIDFCIKKHDQIFSGNARGSLQHWKSTKKILDLVVHGKWANASVPMLEDAASTIRPFIQLVFSRSALKD